MPAGNGWFHFSAKYKIRPTADQFNAEPFGRVKEYDNFGGIILGGDSSRKNARRQRKKAAV
jgi:hypothetical protein